MDFVLMCDKPQTWSYEFERLEISIKKKKKKETIPFSFN